MSKKNHEKATVSLICCGNSCSFQGNIQFCRGVQKDSANQLDQAFFSELFPFLKRDTLWDKPISQYAVRGSFAKSQEVYDLVIPMIHLWLGACAHIC